MAGPARAAIHHYGVPWFEPIDRWVLPPTVTVKPDTSRAARDVPGLAGYDFVSKFATSAALVRELSPAHSSLSSSPSCADSGE